MAITTPYSSPNWAKRMMRLNTPKVPKRPDENDPAQAALGMFNMGMRAGPDGGLQPVQDYGGLLQKASQGVNSMTRGVKGGQLSSLGKPLNSMYEQNPGFFNRGGSAGGAAQFGEMLAQRGQTTGATLPNDTPGAASQAARANMMQPGAFSGMVKNVNRPVDNTLVEKRGFGSPVASTQAGGSAAGSQAPSQQAANRAKLEEAVSAKKLLQEVQKPIMQVEQNGGNKSIQTQYGSGSSTQMGPKRKEGLIGGRPFSEVMQGLANKPGLARPGDKFQPQQWDDGLKRRKTK